MNDETCSPLQQKKFTCYTSESLHKLKTLWNSRHSDVPIKSNDEREIWNALKKHMSDVCDIESCWLRQNFAKHNLNNELRYYTFAPKAPTEWQKNKNEWLSSIDIEQVMRQYEEHYKDFAFLGPSPIDFNSKKLYGECVWDDLCHFNITDMLKKHKKRIGMVFNLDEHWKDGSHWVSMFIDIPTKQICYFDSAGEDIPIEVKNLVEKVENQGKQLDIDFKFHKNHPFEHQMKDSECGVYSIYFIESMLKNPRFTRFKHTRVTDKEMEKHRNIYFRI
jgi:hypothetical protein